MLFIISLITEGAIVQKNKERRPDLLFEIENTNNKTRETVIEKTTPFFSSGDSRDATTAAARPTTERRRFQHLFPLSSVDA